MRIVSVFDSINLYANVQNNGSEQYSDFVKIICSPVPDHYRFKNQNKTQNNT